MDEHDDGEMLRHEAGGHRPVRELLIDDGERLVHRLGVRGSGRDVDDRGQPVEEQFPGACAEGEAAADEEGALAPARSGGTVARGGEEGCGGDGGGVQVAAEGEGVRAGEEMIAGVDPSGRRAVVTGLHPALRASGAARLVVSSGARRGAPFGFGDPYFARRPYDPWTAYGQSKSAGVLLAVGARRWADDGITANALHPGFLLTRLRRHLDDDTMRAFGVRDGEGNLTSPSFYKSPAQGAATSVLPAASPLLDGVTGRYFEDNQEARIVRGDEEGRVGGVAAHALDPETADRLWEYAAAAVSRTV